MSNSKEPATKADLAAAEERITGLVRETENRMVGLIQESETRVVGLIQESETRVVGLIQESETRVVGLIQESETRVVEFVRETETHLLSAFYDFAESNQRRMTEVERSHTGLIDRVGLLERRITELEKRLNMPPAS
jgi:hypothetical protein